MKKLNIGIFLSLLLMVGLCSCGEQKSNTKLVLNEVLIENESNFQDDYGVHSAWIEIFNRSFGSADLAGSSRLVYPADVKIIRVPCSCRVNPMFILRAFEKGADGVILCGCHPGDCHYSTGNYYARRRMALLFSMLDYIGVEHGRTRVEWVSAAEGVKFSQTMNEFVAKITSLGKNVRLEDLRCRK